MNVSKCAAFVQKPLAKRKTYVLNNAHPFQLGQEMIRFIQPWESTSYLGAKFDLAKGVVLRNWVEVVEEWCKKLN